MDPLTIITTVAGIIKTLVDLGPTVIKAAEDATPFAEAIYATLTGKDVTPDQLAALEAEIASLSAELQADLPPDDGTTTT